MSQFVSPGIRTPQCAKKLGVESHDFITAEILIGEALKDDDSGNKTDSSVGCSSSSSSTNSGGSNETSSDSE